jgi:hypothetical protein
MAKRSTMGNADAARRADTSVPRRGVRFDCIGGRHQPSSIRVAMLSAETIALADCTDRHKPCIIVSGPWPQKSGLPIERGFKLELPEAVRLGRNILQLCIEELNAQRNLRRQTPEKKNAPAPSVGEADRPE